MPAELLTDPRSVRAPDAAAFSAPPLPGLRAQLPLKLILLPLLTALFCIPYFIIGWHPLFVPATLPLTLLDRAIPFDPRWAVVYESAYLLIPLCPLLASTRLQLRRYVAAFVMVTLVGLSVCLFFPIRAPRPMAPAASPLYAAIIAVDPSTNAFPSMHMALASQSLLFGAYLFRGANARWRWPALTVGIIWLAAIAYATLATRQHYALDLPAGVALACLCHALIFRRRA